MKATIATVVHVSAAVLSFIVPNVHGHMSLLSPVSRQMWYTQMFQEWPFESMEFCPGCYNSRGTTLIRERAIDRTDPEILAEYGGGEFPKYWAYLKGEVCDNGNYLERDEIAVRHGVCGDPSQADEDEIYLYSTPNKNWPVITTYKKGQKILIKTIVSAYHWGHLEFFLCDVGDLEDGEEKVVPQSCFNKYPLNRADDDVANSPIDANFPGRYYVDPECRGEERSEELPENAPDGYMIRMNYLLPENVTCKRCILQMVYYAGIACKHPGYDDFDPPFWPSTCAPNKEDWIKTIQLVCGEDGNYPQEFWACADIAITEDGEPPVTPAPTSANPECNIRADAYEQCGGDGYTGPTCCRDGYDCHSFGSCYSQCQPIPGACAEKWKQCGGLTKGGYWPGPHCCWPGTTCLSWANENYFACVPDDHEFESEAEDEATKEAEDTL